MEIEEKYKTLRAAIIRVIGVEDNQAELIGILNELRRVSDADVDTLGVVVALIETGN